MSRWYRAYEGTVTDAKLGEAALVAEVSRSISIAVWHCILESASSRNQSGGFDITARRVSVILCEPVSAIEKVFLAFEELHLIKDSVVQAWSKRQYESDNSRPPSHVWNALRASVFSRDDYTCAYCGERGVSLECDHIIPVSRGGSNDMANLATACRPCNRAKRDKLVSEWLQ